MSREKQIEEMTKVIDRAKYDMWVGKAHQSTLHTIAEEECFARLVTKHYGHKSR